jgi:heat shock protein HslJ
MPTTECVTMRAAKILVLASVGLSACAMREEPTAPAAPAPAPASTPAPTPAPTPPTHLGAWYWVGTIGAEATVIARDPARYRIEPMDDGRIAVQADCNRGGGSYEMANRYEVRIGPIGLTKMGCPPESQDRIFLADLAAARSFGAGAEWMLVDLLEDRGVMHFARSEQARLAHYECKSGAPFWVAYGDGHARLMADGRVLRLPQIEAASGAKYSDGTVTLHGNDEQALLEGIGAGRSGCVAGPI